MDTPPIDIAGLRLDYAAHGLRRADLDSDPIRQFTLWFTDAANAGIRDANAMSLATASPDGLVVPGVGAFAACMAGLAAVGGPKIIAERLAGGRPTLAICVGHQVLFQAGIEHGVRAEGCRIWPGLVERLHAERLPHMGWNTIRTADGSRLFTGVESEHFYFVHSYGVRALPAAPERRPPVGVTVSPIRKEVRRRNKVHLAFVSAQPCLICRRSPCDAHHLKFAQPQALGRKVSDEFAVPLCRDHHLDLHRHGARVVC